MEISLQLPVLTPAEVTRCFRMQYGDNTGTCFLHSHAGLIAFVTAAHIIENMISGDNILLQQDGIWKSYSVIEVHTNDASDIAIFTLENVVLDRAWDEAEIKMCLGHPVIYLGYPHGLVGDYPMQEGSSSPIAKVAHWSGTIKIKGVEVSLYDGLNNPGFSGGPIFHRAIGSAKNSVVGIINGYRHEREKMGQVFEKEGEKETPVPNQFVKLNSGIIYAAPIKTATGLFGSLAHGQPTSTN